MRLTTSAGLEGTFWPSDFRLRLYFCLSLFTCFYVLACAGGNKITYDSMAYMAAAKSLGEGMGLLNQFGDPYVAWPPLYPLLLLAGLAWMKTFVFLLHLLCGIATLCLWAKMAGSSLKTAEMQFLFLLVLSISTPFFMLFVFVWSEAVFILLFSAYLCTLQRVTQQKTGKTILLATLFAFLMLLQRNAGIFILAGSIAGIALNYTCLDKRQLKYLLLQGIVAASGFGLWNLYVLFYKGNEHILTEVVPEFSFLRNGKLVLSELGKLYVPEPLNIAFGLGVLVPCLFLAGYQLYRQKDVWLRLLLVIFLTYLSVWIIVPAVWVVVPAGEEDISRFLAVIIPVVHLFFFLFLEERVKKHGRKTYIFFLVLAGGWLVYPLMRIFSNALLWHGMNGL